jgi:hypothetical protein
MDMTVDTGTKPDPEYVNLIQVLGPDYIDVISAARGGRHPSTCVTDGRIDYIFFNSRGSSWLTLADGGHIDRLPGLPEDPYAYLSDHFASCITLRACFV